VIDTKKLRCGLHIAQIVRVYAREFGKMPLFGKKDSNKKIKKDGKDDRSPSVEDKYILKDLLGT
jgi:hypothetical protein